MITQTYQVDGSNFSAAGEASTAVKRLLKSLHLPSDVVRRAVVCMYEGEINMVIHASGGTATVSISEESITIDLQDHGPGINNLDQAMQEGWSTASDQVRGLGFGAGMGLPNMRRNADEMTVTSEPGVGTRVIMVIHLLREDHP